MGTNLSFVSNLCESINQRTFPIYEFACSRTSSFLRIALSESLGRNPIGECFVRQCGPMFFNLTPLVKPVWMKGLRRCADAFVRVWDQNGQFGPYVYLNTGEIVVAHSTSGAQIPSALALAALAFPERAENYLRVARSAGRAFAEEDLRSGVTSGGLGDALQCADSMLVDSVRQIPEHLPR